MSKSPLFLASTWSLEIFQNFARKRRSWYCYMKKTTKNTQHKLRRDRDTGYRCPQKTEGQERQLSRAQEQQRSSHGHVEKHRKIRPWWLEMIKIQIKIIIFRKVILKKSLVLDPKIDSVMVEIEKILQAGNNDSKHLERLCQWSHVIVKTFFCRGENMRLCRVNGLKRCHKNFYRIKTLGLGLEISWV